MQFAGQLSDRALTGVQYNGQPPPWLDLAVPDTWLDPRDWRRGDDCVWPTPALCRVPHLDHATRAAQLVVAVNDGERDPYRFAASLGIRITMRELAASSGGLEAGLVPDFGHSFEVVCDPWTSGDSPGDALRFRVAHELAHTLFYEWDAEPPHRTGPGDVTEERFCDAFATALASGDPPHAPRRHGEVVW